MQSLSKSLSGENVFHDSTMTTKLSERMTYRDWVLQYRKQMPNGDKPTGDTLEFENDGLRFKITSRNTCMVAFGLYQNLTSIVIPPSVKYEGDDYSVTSIGAGAFYRCNNLTSVSLQEGLICIGDNAFEGCGKLQEISLPDSLQAIGRKAFCSCTSLRSILLPENLRVIGACAFLGCGSLTGIAIHQGVNTIEERVFSGCKSLADVNLPETLITIQAEAFSACSSLDRINLSEHIVSIGPFAFSGCDKLCSSFFPEKLQKGLDLIGLSSNSVTVEPEFFVKNKET